MRARPRGRGSPGRATRRQPASCCRARAGKKRMPGGRRGGDLPARAPLSLWTWTGNSARQLSWAGSVSHYRFGSGTGKLPDREESPNSEARTRGYLRPLPFGLQVDPINLRIVRSRISKPCHLHFSHAFRVRTVQRACSCELHLARSRSQIQAPVRAAWPYRPVVYVLPHGDNEAPRSS